MHSCDRGCLRSQEEAAGEGALSRGPCAPGGGGKKELLVPETVIPEARGALTLIYCRSMSARTLKSEMYWPRTELPSWLLLPVKGLGLVRSARSGQLREAERLRQAGCEGERSEGRERLSGPDRHQPGLWCLLASPVLWMQGCCPHWEWEHFFRTNEKL